MEPVKPKKWKNGNTPIRQSSLATQYTCAMPSMFARTFRCDSITPFGVPVLPLEKMTVARWSGLRSPRTNSHSRSEEHTSELQSRPHLVCRLLLEKKKKK